MKLLLIVGFKDREGTRVHSIAKIGPERASILLKVTQFVYSSFYNNCDACNVLVST